MKIIAHIVSFQPYPVWCLFTCLFTTRFISFYSWCCPVSLWSCSWSTLITRRSLFIRSLRVHTSPLFSQSDRNTSYFVSFKCSFNPLFPGHCHLYHDDLLDWASVLASCALFLLKLQSLLQVHSHLPLSLAVINIPVSFLRVSPGLTKLINLSAFDSFFLI